MISAALVYMYRSMYNASRPFPGGLQSYVYYLEYFS